MVASDDLKPPFRELGHLFFLGGGKGGRRAVKYPRNVGDISPKHDWLLVEPTQLKNMIAKMGSSSPNSRDEN